MEETIRICDGESASDLRQSLQRLNACLFPVKYKDTYYRDAVLAGSYTKLAFYKDACVGNIACRLEETGPYIRVYIMTLGVLPSYRRMGIGSKLLQSVLGLCQQDPRVVDVYLHVQTNNDEAMEFYKNFDFQIVDTIFNYYIRLDPPDCYVLSLRLR
ncbi:N-alpha-acetyltransferase 50 [Selaginella moellendorffii]|nr:N-alpha-acetyltransferase 50 [Selaginella moellendorffii]|eukprot:XP_002993121.2 N-alpha-acetyltransferase 50 [Selaginella moellendorffii]